MKCPYCNEKETKVLESRMSEEDKAIRRRRECTKCEKRFTTYERAELEDIYVKKRDAKTQPFSREKLRNGLLRACEKRPVAQEIIEKAVEEIEATIRTKGKTEVKSSYIGRKVMEKLRDLDEVAYVRFASVYKKFKALEHFEKEIKTLKEEVKP